MLSVRIAFVFIFIVAICSSQGYRLNVKDVIPPEMVNEVIASAERPTGGSFAYSRPYMPFGQFGKPYGYNIRPIPGFGQIQGQPILSGEEPEQIISEEPIIEEPINAEESENVEEAEEPIIEKRAIEDVVPIIIEIPVQEIIGEEFIPDEVDESQINELYEQDAQDGEEPGFLREL